MPVTRSFWHTEGRAALRPVAALLFCAGLLAFAVEAHAQSPLGVGSAEPSFEIGGPFGFFFRWINENQAWFYRTLTHALIAMRSDPWALSGLIGLSFAYGIFHAAGPGHGKAVISSYMIANEIELKRGASLSFISSILQGIVAILVVGTVYLLLRGTGMMTAATQAMEIASFILVVLFGAWLLAKKLRAMRPRLGAISGSAIMAGSTSMTGRGPTGLNFQAVEIAPHEMTGDDGYCETCGVSHIADPELLKGNRFNLREAWSAILAVGLRPCSGAILVMSFSLLNGIYLGGILSVFAMSLGTAITVTILATIAVTAKDLAMRIGGRAPARRQRIGDWIEIGGALFVMLVGLALLGASLQT